MGKKFKVTFSHSFGEYRVKYYATRPTRKMLSRLADRYSREYGAYVFPSVEEVSNG